MIALTLSGGPVQVTAAQIAYYTAAHGGSGTQVYFNGAPTLTVSESVATITAAINALA